MRLQAGRKQSLPAPRASKKYPALMERFICVWVFVFKTAFERIHDTGSRLKVQARADSCKRVRTAGLHTESCGCSALPERIVLSIHRRWRTCDVRYTNTKPPHLFCKAKPRRPLKSIYALDAVAARTEILDSNAFSIQSLVEHGYRFGDLPRRVEGAISFIPSFATVCHAAV